MEKIEIIKKIEIMTPEEMINLGEKIGTNLKENMVVLMEGDLGAGKTTMTKGIAKALGISRVVNSPTFTIMKIYEGGRLPLYHMDVYRLDNHSGDEYLEEYFENEGVTIIEWAHRISDILPNEYLLVNIDYLENGNRLVTLKANSSEYQKLLESVNI